VRPNKDGSANGRLEMIEVGVGASAFDDVRLAGIAGRVDSGIRAISLQVGPWESKSIIID
jgi:hypothetical protein